MSACLREEAALSRRGTGIVCERRAELIEQLFDTLLGSLYVVILDTAHVV
jgi:hypothetical protein